MEQPRAQHYLFAHRILPSIVDEMGIEFINKFKEFDNEKWIKIWNDFGNELENVHKVRHQGLSAKYIENEKYEGIFISLPEPENVLEAYFIFVFLNKSKLKSQNKKNIPRYLTLELGFDHIEEKKSTVVCEWRDQQHLNLGTGPKPLLEEFLAYVVRNILSE